MATRWIPGQARLGLLPPCALQGSGSGSDVDKDRQGSKQWAVAEQTGAQAREDAESQEGQLLHSWPPPSSDGTSDVVVQAETLLGLPAATPQYSPRRCTMHKLSSGPQLPSSPAENEVECCLRCSSAACFVIPLGVGFFQFNRTCSAGKVLASH